MTEQLCLYRFSLPTIETKRLILRPVKTSDAKDLFSYAKDPKVSEHVLWDAHRSLSDSRAFIRSMKHQYRQGFPGSFAIVLRSNQKMIGTIGFMSIHRDYHSAEIGYSLSREYWNCGYMTEALNEVLDYAFEVLHLNRIEAQHELSNPASGRVMEKCGMCFEGILKQRIRNKGKYVDVKLYAILRQDYQKRK